MPETACLHIQARDTDPIRVVELPGVSVRIGRASYCEVRLSEPDLADEECRLRRRGGTWHVVPSHRNASVWLEGQSINQPCPIEFDVPFRVGECWLTLRPSRTAVFDWNTYRTPPPLERPRVSDLTTEAPLESATIAADARPDSLSRWQTRRLQTRGGPGESLKQQRWEERWKAAGERLRARTAESAPPYRPEVVSPPPDPDRAGEDQPESGGDREKTGVRVRTISRRMTTEQASPPPSVLEDIPSASASSTLLSPPTTRPAKSRPVSGRVREPEVEPGDNVGLRDEVHPISEEAPAVAFESEPARELPPFFQQLYERGVSIPSLDEEENPEERWSDPWDEKSRSEPAETLPDRPASNERERFSSDAIPRFPEPSEAAFTLTHSPREGRPETSNPPRLEEGRGEGCFEPDTRSVAAKIDAEDDPGRWAYDALFEFESDTRQAEPVARGSERNAPGGPHRRPRRSSVRARRVTTQPIQNEPGYEDFPTTAPSSTTAREWPKARDIFAANRLRADRAESSCSLSRRRARQPIPTEAREPGHWTVPLWLGWPLAMVVALVVGVVGVTMGWIWSVDAFAAGQVADRLMRAGEALDPLPETVARPDSAWWKTTSANLMHWAFYLDRAEAGKPEVNQEVETLLETASKSSPVEPQVRFAKTRPVTGVGREVALFQGLGTSHDVLALAWSGHQLLASGKHEAALEMYRKALEMASRAEVARLRLPAFDDDPQVRRYALPHEALIGVVIRDMAAQDRWTSSEWTRALPDFAVVPLVAARVLRERGELDVAEKLLESLTAEARDIPPAGTSSAVHLAAQAEALAMKSRWNEADQRYRQAIGLMPVDAVRRSWWVNVADIALRLNDEAKRQGALEAARGQDESDEIARHALEMLKYSGERSKS